MLQALSPLDGRYAARFSKIVALLLALASVARADLVGHHAGASQLLLSGDGKVAFTGDYAKTRVWDVEGKRELAMLPSRALAVSGDGGRALCVSVNQGVVRYNFWQLVGGNWQRGTSVVQRSKNLPLIDAVFDGDEAIVMSLGRVERFAPDGTTRTSHQYDEGDRLALGSPKTSPPVGALSPDGKRLVLWDRGWARVCDATTGKRLTPLYEPKELVLNFGRTYRFSPDNSLVSQGLQYVGTDEAYFAEDGPPLRARLLVYNARNGAPLHTLENVREFHAPFWPADGGRSLVFQVKDASSQWKLERRDARTNAVLPLNLSKPSLPERWLLTLIFANDGKSCVALDESRDIWAEQVRPN